MQRTFLFVSRERSPDQGMPQYIFDVESVYLKEPEDELQTHIAEVRTEVIHREKGDILFEAVIPVAYHAYGVYPDVKAVASQIPRPSLQREVLFRVKRYVKKLRPFL